MLNVHFKRHGSADWLELQGLEKFNIRTNKTHDYIYIEIQGTTLHLQEVVDSQRVRSKSYKLGKTMSWDVIQNRIAKFIGEPVNLGHFIESYHIPQRDHGTDRDMINGIDVTGMTTREVMNSTGINLREYWNDWKLSEKVYDCLDSHSKTILNMSFKELFQLIHWNCHKQDFEKTFFSEITCKENNQPIF